MIPNGDKVKKEESEESCTCGREVIAVVNSELTKVGWICKLCKMWVNKCICDPLVNSTQREKEKITRISQKTISLAKSFYISTGKTLKLEIRPETNLADAVEDARMYLENPDCQHSRIEFKFGHCYIVVARLRN